MNYIKNNKVFILLTTILFIIISTLGYLIIDGKEPEEIMHPVDNEEIDTYIKSFDGTFDEVNRCIELKFDIKEVNKLIVKSEIWYDDKKLVEVSNNHSITLPLSTYGFITGDNKFDLKVFLEDSTVLEKSVFVYLQEAFEIKVHERQENNKIIYNIEYYYDIRNRVSVPNIAVPSSTDPVDIQYVSAKEVGKDGNYVKMNCVYELDYSELEKGDYEIELYWSFPSLNIKYNHVSKFTKGE